MDADSDGRYDLTVASPEATLVWLLGDGAPVQVQLAEFPLRAVAYADVDCDGVPDLVGLANDGVFVRRSARR